MTRARGIFALTLAFAAAGCQTPPTQTPPAPRAPVVPGGGRTVESSRTSTLVVYGMGCPQCANNVDKQLLKVPGVEQVKVNLGTGNVLVTFADDAARPSQAQLAKAVSNSGYTLVRVQTP